MAFLQVSGYAAGPPSSITHPLTGRPTADVTLAVPAVPWKQGDRVRVEVQDGPTYEMTVERVGPRGGFASAHLVGGSGGLSREIGPKWYRDIPVNTVVREILEECGEQAGEIDLPGTLPSWLRPAGPAHEALRAVMMRYPDRVWHMDPDGTVHAGAPTWPEYPDPVAIEEEDAASGLFRVAMTPSLKAGDHVTLTRGEEEIGKRVTRVTHSIGTVHSYPKPQVRLRTLVHTGDGHDLGVSGLEAVVQRGTRWTDYCALYPCEVLRDHGDHTLDLRPEHPLMPELTRVRLVLPAPGSRVKLRKGATVLLSFQAGDPARPVVLHYGDGTLERLELKTGLGQTVVIDDDRGKVSPEDRLYQQPRVTLRDAAGQSVELWAEKGRERVQVKDKAGQTVRLDPVAGRVEVRGTSEVIVRADTTVLVKAGATVDVEAGVVNVNGGRVNLAGGGPAVGRVGDAVRVDGVDSTGGVITLIGTITSGSGKVGSG